MKARSRGKRLVSNDRRSPPGAEKSLLYCKFQRKVHPMPIVEGGVEVARELSLYLTKLAKYEALLAEFEQGKNKSDCALAQHARDMARYVHAIHAWNADRSLGTPTSGRPVSPGLPPAPFVGAKPLKPTMPLGYQIYGNRTAPKLPAPGKGQSYHEARVGADRKGGAGQHRIVVLADDNTGNVYARYSTSDHYGDNARSTRASWSKF